MPEKRTPDLVLVNPGGKREVYQTLSTGLAAVEPPVWAGLIAAFVRGRGFHVIIIDTAAEGIGPDETAARIAEISPTLTAVVVYGQNPSASTMVMPAASTLCRAIKEAAPEQEVLLLGREELGALLELGLLLDGQEVHGAHAVELALELGHLALELVPVHVGLFVVGVEFGQLAPVCFADLFDEVGDAHLLLAVAKAEALGLLVVLAEGGACVLGIVAELCDLLEERRAAVLGSHSFLGERVLALEKLLDSALLGCNLVGSGLTPRGECLELFTCLLLHGLDVADVPAEAVEGAAEVLALGGGPRPCHGQLGDLTLDGAAPLVGRLAFLLQRAHLAFEVLFLAVELLDGRHYLTDARPSLLEDGLEVVDLAAADEGLFFEVSDAVAEAGLLFAGGGELEVEVVECLAGLLELGVEDGGFGDEVVALASELGELGVEQVDLGGEGAELVLAREDARALVWAAAGDWPHGVEDVAAERGEADVSLRVAGDTDGRIEVGDEIGVAEQVLDGGAASVVVGHEVECAANNAGMLEALEPVPTVAVEAVEGEEGGSAAVYRLEVGYGFGSGVERVSHKVLHGPA